MPVRSKPKKSKPVSPERLNQMTWAYAIPLMLEAALRNGVFDALAGGVKDLDQLAAATGASARGLRGICNALASIDLLKKTKDRYTLTPESAAFLVRSSPAYRGGVFHHISSQLLPKWMKLEEVVRTGQPDGSVHTEQAAEFFEKFVEDIFPMSYMATQTLADAMKLAKSRSEVKVLDIAAGSGVWGIGLAQRSPQVRVRAVDWPKVIPVTRRVAGRFGVADRFTFVEGSMHTADLGTGHNIATLGHILHAEGPEGSRALIRRVYDALAPGGTIVVSEFVPDDDRSGPTHALIFAVNMLVNTEAGDTFTFKEIKGWLTEAGFKKIRQLPAPAPSPLILATKPG